MIYKYNKTLGGSGMFIGFPSPNTKKKKKKQFNFFNDLTGLQQREEQAS